MKTFFLILFSGHLALAQTLTCQWQDSETYNRDYYRQDAQFQLELNGRTARITEDSYFKRKYRPCWNGMLSSCTFNFNFDNDKPFNIYANDGHQILMEQQWWFTSQLELVFSKDITELKNGESLELEINGDDGDNTEIIADLFICKAH